MQGKNNGCLFRFLIEKSNNIQIAFIIYPCVHLQDFLLPCLATKENFIVSSTLILHFRISAVQLKELLALASN